MAQPGQSSRRNIERHTALTAVLGCDRPLVVKQDEGNALVVAPHRLGAQLQQSIKVVHPGIGQRWGAGGQQPGRRLELGQQPGVLAEGTFRVGLRQGGQGAGGRAGKGMR